MNRKWINSEVERLKALKENAKTIEVKQIIERQIKRLERERGRRKLGFLIG